jgi:hypothetical protein
MLESPDQYRNIPHILIFRNAFLYIVLNANIIRMLGCCLMTLNKKSARFEREPDIQEYILIFPYKIGKRKGILNRIEDHCTQKKIEHIKENIIGKLHVISSSGGGKLSCDCCNESHMISDFAKPYSMLVKLPKENIFVVESEWKVLYLKSQITELVDIMMYLGATEVSFNVVNINTNNNEIGLSTNLSEYGINVGVDLEVKHEDTGHNYVSGKLIFKNPSINVNILFDSSRFHYLPMKFDWQHMIQQRLQSGISAYRIKSFADDHQQMSHVVQLSLQKIGVSARDMKSVRNNVMIDMYASFCDLSPNEFMKNSIPILQDRWSPNYNSNKNKHINSDSTASPETSLEKILEHDTDINLNVAQDKTTNLVITSNVGSSDDSSKETSKDIDKLKSHAISVSTSIESPKN